eukprot:TRINITY_DN15336_c0_g2_i5.p1 TRINITY_DN15336_c0_g2~~TRINITY_DN15336_c0_g2_i5.p1  ORF type:complete len:458 (+),score=71.32 TRINITY_DN15336_c0_g2_i5:70-1443(+)
MCRLDVDPLDWEERSDAIPFWQHAVAGSLAGIAEHVGMFPLDTVKTRMQASTGSSGGLLQHMRSVASERGLLGFWRGASVIGAGCVPAHCGLFLTYETAKRRVLRPDAHQPVLSAMCGGAASLVHDAILTPHDVIKQRLQLGSYKSTIHCVLKTYRVEGLGAFYRSLPVTLVSNAPNTAILAAVNESMKVALGLNKAGKSSDLGLFFACGGVGGAVAAATTLPLDVVKTRLQTQGVTQKDPAGVHRGAWNVVQAIAQNEGLRGFYRGVLPRMLVSAPAAAICWGTYSSVVSLLSSGPHEGLTRSVAAAVDGADVAAGIGAEEEERDPLEWETWDPRSVPLWKHMVAGSAAGVMEHVAMYPVDTVKTQMQAAPAVPGAAPLTVRQTVRNIIEQEGVGALFRGCYVIGAACIPAHIGLFGTYEMTKLMLLKSGDEKDHAPLRAALCGALSTTIRLTPAW